jgi:AmiR/NasT family two-component response regulator
VTENVVHLRSPDGTPTRQQQREADQLRAARESRNVIEQAKSAMASRFGITTDESFELMRGLARSQNRSLHEFAAEVVANDGRLG